MASSLVKRWIVSIVVYRLGHRAAQPRTAGSEYTPWRRFKHGRKKGGEGIGYSGHKHQKGEKELTIAENNGFVIAPITVKPVNEHDCVLLPETVTQFVAFTREVRLDVRGSAFTLDSGFDSHDNRTIIKEHGMIPVIYPNIRNTKQAIKIAQKFRWFNRNIYKKRYTIERTFAWQDVYRRLAVSYDRLKATRRGFRYLAYSMINLRVLFNDS